MIRHIPVTIAFDEDKVREIAEKIIYRRTSKIVKQLIKEQMASIKAQINDAILAARCGGRRWQS